MTSSRFRVFRGFIALIGVIALGALPIAQGTVSPGPLVVWGTDNLAQTGPPAGDFSALASGGGLQTLALTADGRLYLNVGGPISQPPITALRFTAVGVGRDHGLAIRTDGGILPWGNTPAGMAATQGTPTTGVPGQFVAVTGNGSASLALDRDGNVVVWGAGGAPAPAGLKFQAIAARLNYMLALGVDGNVYGWGAGTSNFTDSVPRWTDEWPGQFMAPREAGTPYTAIAAGLGTVAPYGLIVALRADGRVVVWDPSGTTGPAPAGVVFAQPATPTTPTIAAGSGYAVGIDIEGHLHAWGDARYTAAVPRGIYSAVNAAVGHVTAIAVPDPRLTELSPVNVWLGLKNSGDVGTKFDLLAEVLKNGDVVGSGQLNNVPGGSSGFNNAIERTFGLSLPQSVSMDSGDMLSLRVSVRIAEGVPGHRSGTARLWFNDAAADSSFGATIGGYAPPRYLVDSAQSAFALSTAAGSGPRKSVDVFVDRAAAGNPFKPFGTWNIVLQ
jgi:hypothetical protein